LETMRTDVNYMVKQISTKYLLKLNPISFTDEENATEGLEIQGNSFRLKLLLTYHRICEKLSHWIV